MEKDLIILRSGSFTHCLSNNSQIYDSPGQMMGRKTYFSFHFLQVNCGLSNGKEALASFSLSSPAITLPPLLLSLPSYSLVATAVLTAIFSLACLLALLLTRQLQRRKYRTTQK